MHGDGGEPAIVTGHDTEAFEKGFTMVEGGLAFFGIIGNDHVEVVEGNVFLGGGFHDADAPVDVGRVAITKVVGCGNGKVGTGVESLMADEHAVTEGFPVEVLRRRETTMVEEVSFGVYDVRVAIKDGGGITGGRFFCYIGRCNKRTVPL